MQQLAVRAGAICVAVFLVFGIGACTDDPKDDTNNGNNNGGSVDCDGQTLSVTLEQPDPAVGFAPFSVSYRGNVTFVQNVDYDWTFDFGDGTTATGQNGQPAATREYTDAGKYPVTLTISDTTCDLQYQATSEVEVYGRVELTGQDLVVNPRNLNVLDEATITMKVTNEADQALRLPVTVSFFLSERPAVLWEDISALLPLTNVTISPDDQGISIGSGARVSVDQVAVIPREVGSGSYYLVAAIDLTDQIGEDDDRRNNIVVSGTPIVVSNTLEDAPDLVVDQVQVGPATAFRRLTQISLNADVKNIGTNFSPDSTYGVYIQNGDTFDPETATRIFTSDGILIDNRPPDNVFQVRGQVIVLAEPIELGDGDPDLEITVVVCADPDDDILEGSPEDTDSGAEGNNCGSSMTSIVISNQAQPGIDIALVNFAFSPTSTFLDGTVEVTLTVDNFGDTPTSSFFCGVFLSANETLEVADDPRLANVNFSRLQPNLEEPVVVSRVATVPAFFDIGTFWVFAYCDPSNVVNETFEDNNIVRLPEQITIAASAIIDLVVTDITIDPAEIGDGEPVTITATVENTGTTGAGPSTLGVRISRDQEVGPEDTEVAVGMVPSLPAGTSVEVEMNIDTLLCDIFQDSYYLGINIDPSNLVPEVDETNNQTVLDEQITFVGPRCSCEDDLYDPNNTPRTAVPLGGGEFDDLTICTGGGRDYFGVDLTVGQSVNVRLMLQHAGDCTNLDMRLLDQNFQTIGESTSDGPLEQADLFLVQQQGRYVIEVFGRTGCDVNRYDLGIEVISPGAGVDLTGTGLTLDNNNPSLAEEVGVSFTTLNIANDDAGDYDITYYLAVDTTIDFINDFNLGSSTVEGGLNGARTRRDESILTIPRDAIGTNYYLCAVIDSGEDVSETNEDNNIVCSEQIEVDTSCFDPFEFNDTPQDATEIEPGVFQNLNVCNNGRQDHYRFCVESGTELEVSVEFVHAEGDIDLCILEDREGYPAVGCSTSTNNTESVGIEYVGGAQCFIARVQLNDRNEVANDYEMEVRAEPADPLLACDDLYEPNNNFDQALESEADLFDAINDETVIDRCPEDDFDFFYVDVVAGPTMELCVENHESNPMPFNMNLTLYDPQRRQLQANTGPNPCITQRLTVSGRYFVRIWATNQDRRAVRYQVSVAGLFGVDLSGRDLNITPTEIVPGETFVIYDFTVENGRSDRAEDVAYGVYYSTDPIIDPETDTLVAERTIGGIDGFSEVDVQDIISLEPNEAFQPGVGYLGIYLDHEDLVDEENETNNRLQSEITMVVCDDDEFEGNTSLGEAASIDLGTSYDDLNLCPNSEDWYCASDVPAGLHRATATFALDAPNDRASDLQMQVVTANDGVLDSIVGFNLDLADNAVVDFSLDSASDVCVRIFANQEGRSTNSYSLVVIGLDD
jgi:PKD repeat protein